MGKNGIRQKHKIYVKSSAESPHLWPHHASDTSRVLSCGRTGEGETTTTTAARARGPRARRRVGHSAAVCVVMCVMAQCTVSCHKFGVLRAGTRLETGRRTRRSHYIQYPSVAEMGKTCLLWPMPTSSTNWNNSLYRSNNMSMM